MTLVNYVQNVNYVNIYKNIFIIYLSETSDAIGITI